MVAGHLATLSERAWEEHIEYHPEGWRYKLVLKKGLEYQHEYFNHTYESEPTDIQELLTEWQIKHKFEWLRYAYRKVYFFRSMADVLRAKLAFGELIDTAIECRPRQQIEAEMRRAVREKARKNKTIMRKASQVVIIDLAAKEVVPQWKKEGKKKS